jgi:hypothetical protein
MALAAQSLAVVYDISQLRVLINRFLMVRVCGGRLTPILRTFLA